MMVSRRGLLAGAGASAAGAAGLGALLRGGDETSASAAAKPRAATAGPRAEPFHGAHQVGITTPQQEHLHLVAFDLATDDQAALRELLRAWSAAAAALAAGKGLDAVLAERGLEPSGEATDHAPARLTVTLGVGRSLFVAGGADRLGLRDRLPAALAPLPGFPGDALEERFSAGDLALQVCGDDPQVVFHATHTLTRIAHGLAKTRWLQAGFSRGRAPGATPRNPLGFLDGSRNLDPATAGAQLWAGDDPSWMRGGSYLVARRIRTLLDAWDVTTLDEQERSIGRRKAGGAPLNGTREGDTPDVGALPPDAHVRLAAPESNGGATLLRRAYSYTDGVDHVTGQLDAGLVFICFQRDPREQFVPIQRRLAESDALNKHVVHTGSAVFACPPGCQPGGFVGEGLFG